ncbi:MAG: inorganic diphosphatase [Longimicrobiales bacterium]|nr:inorganic diphosphatase [Longimicrobiales bacterium]
MVVEVPAGTSEKWEVDAATGALVLEFEDGAPRIVRYLAYPANYGMVPRTLLPSEEGGDGDPLDVVLLGSAVERGRVVQARPVGLLRLLDGGERDDKIIAVPATGPFEGVHSMEQLEGRYPGVLEILETWFTRYKGAGAIVSEGFADRAEALRMIEGAAAAFDARASRLR